MLCPPSTTQTAIMSLVEKFLLLALALFVALILAQLVGRWLGRRRLRLHGSGDRPGAGTVEGAVFALLGLLIAFTFTSAAGQFDQRRDLIAAQVNDLGTAWLRLDLLPAEDQPGVREAFRHYVDVMTETWENAGAPERIDALLGELARAQGQVWQQALAATQRDGRAQVATLVLPALNAAFDSTELRISNARMHAHPAVFALLIGLALLAAVVAGHAQAAAEPPDVLHMVVFAMLFSLTLYFILDFEYPRLGLIRLDAADALLDNLRASMG